MAYTDGFTYISGPYDLRRFNVLSTATFLKGAPVMMNGARLIIEASSATAPYIAGIAQNNAASSIYGTEILVLVPNEQTVFAAKVQTGVAASALSAGQAYALEKAGNHIRIDTDSQATPKVMIVPRGDGTTIDSTDSTVHVVFLKDVIAPFGSNASAAL